MTVTVTYECSGCDAKEKSRPLRRRFNGVGGKSYGWGTWEHDSVQSVAPDGWQVFDPYTGCCYCPECWAGIEGPAEAIEDVREDLRAFRPDIFGEGA